MWGWAGGHEGGRVGGWWAVVCVGWVRGCVCARVHVRVWGGRVGRLRVWGERCWVVHGGGREWVKERRQATRRQER